MFFLFLNFKLNTKFYQTIFYAFYIIKTKKKKIALLKIKKINNVLFVVVVVFFLVYNAMQIMNYYFINSKSHELYDI